jgi:hypothetical protein
MRVANRRGRGAALALAATLLGGCPGTLDEALFLASREGGVRRDATAGDGAGADGSGSVCPPGIVDVQRDLLVPRCATAGCHTTMDRIAGLDVESPDLRARLIGVRASAAGACSNRALVSMNGSAVEGVFLGKLTDPPVCGLRMPLGRGTMPLTPTEVACLTEFLRALATSPAPDAGAPAEAGVPTDGGAIPMDAQVPPRDAAAPVRDASGVRG